MTPDFAGRLAISIPKGAIMSKSSSSNANRNRISIPKGAIMRDLALFSQSEMIFISIPKGAIMR